MSPATSPIQPSPSPRTSAIRSAPPRAKRPVRFHRFAANDPLPWASARQKALWALRRSVAHAFSFPIKAVLAGSLPSIVRNPDRFLVFLYPSVPFNPDHQRVGRHSAIPVDVPAGGSLEASTVVERTVSILVEMGC